MTTTDRDSMPGNLLECVINVSEGRDPAALDKITGGAGEWLLDVHSDRDHHRSVLTLAGPATAVENAARAVARAAVATIDVRHHVGAHPRIGALDVVPWVSLDDWPLGNGSIQTSIEARDRFARWAGSTLDLPCFLYGPERSLPDLRRQAWHTLAPDTGPPTAHHSAGAAAVGARPILVAYNLWLAEPDMSRARQIANAIRQPGLRTLALQVGEVVQVSCNLTDPWLLGLEATFDAVASRADVARAELVGLLPRTVLTLVPRHRWQELGLDPSTPIEARLEQAGLDGGRFATHRS